MRRIKMKKYDLTPKQEEAMHVAKYAINENMCFQAIVGKRGGKTVLLSELIDYYEGLKRIYVVAPTVEMVEKNLPNAKKYAVSAKRVLELLENDNTRYEAFTDAIIIVEECEWVDRYSRILRLAAQYNFSVVGVSSRGPNSANIETSQLQHRVITIRAASWDWNTDTPWDSYLDHFAMDFNRAARDFGLYDAHTEGLVSVIKHRVKHLK